MSGRLLNREDLRREFPHVERSAQEVAQRIGLAFPPGWGFALLAFSFGEGGYLTYVSNAERSDIVKALRECAAKLERNADSPAGVLGQKD